PPPPQLPPRLVAERRGAARRRRRVTARGLRAGAEPAADRPEERRARQEGRAEGQREGQGRGSDQGHKARRRRQRVPRVSPVRLEHVPPGTHLDLRELRLQLRRVAQPPGLPTKRAGFAARLFYLSRAATPASLTDVGFGAPGDRQLPFERCQAG